MISARSNTNVAAVWLTSLLLAMVMISGSCNRGVSKTDNTVPVTISVTQTSSYCGGAAPPDYVLQELMTPRPLSGHKVYIREGDDNDFENPVIGEFVSDAGGQIHLNLTPGIYCLVFENRKDRAFGEQMMKRFAEPSANYSAVDKDCLEVWLHTAETVFEVKSVGTNNFSVNYHSHCSWDQWPCVSYFGPLPP